MTDQNTTEQWQVMSQPFSMLAGPMQKNAQTFWKAQGEVLDGMQAFAEGWFERRHAGVKAAQDTFERMCVAKTPMDWWQLCHTWSMGAFQRLMADGMVLREGMSKIADEATTLVPELAKERGETTSVTAPGRARSRAVT